MNTDIEKMAEKAYPGQIYPCDKPSLEDDYRVTLKLREAYENGCKDILDKVVKYAREEFIKGGEGILMKDNPVYNFEFEHLFSYILNLRYES